MIHPTAVVEAGAELGSNVTVGAGAWIEAGAQVGADCVIGPRVTITRYARLGPRCRVHPGAALGEPPQDLGFKGGESFVTLGADCVVREGVTIHRGTQPGSETRVGDGCYLMTNAHLAHNVRLEAGVILASGALLAGYVEVGARAFISGNCVVHQFVRIGRLAMLGGLSGVSKDVPPFCTVRSGEINRLAGLNVVGLRRAGLPAEERRQIQDVFRQLYRAGLPLRAAAQRLCETVPAGPGRELAEFVLQSRRGVCGLERAAAEEEAAGNAEPARTAPEA